VSAHVADDEILAAVEGELDAGRAAMRFVHDHPELAHEEHECAAYLAGELERRGFAVERGAGGMPTAFRAWTGTGPAVGLVAVYDAVPAVRADGSLEPVHSCGHGPQSGGVLAAALALAALGDRLPGTVVVMGCPADEIHAPGTAARGGGKALSAEAGLWDGVDAALYAHAEFFDTAWRQSLWMRRLRVAVAGERTLQPGAPPPPPLRALRAIAAALDELPPDRVMLENLRLDGDVEEGSGLALDARFLVFADDVAGLVAAAQPLRDALAGAAWEEGRVVTGIRPDGGVRAAVADAFAALGRDFVDDPGPLPFATDFGNVSQRVPAALVGVGREGGWAFHTDEGARQFAGPDGEEVMAGTARVLALTTARLLTAPHPPAAPAL
jgi:metal-dependent amidase/aminoacylase/carboxypeptidase family protein